MERVVSGDQPLFSVPSPMQRGVVIFSRFIADLMSNMRIALVMLSLSREMGQLIPIIGSGMVPPGRVLWISIFLLRDHQTG